MGGRTASPRPEKGDDENVQQEKGRQPEQRDHPCERAVPTVLSQGGGDGAAVRRRHRAAAAPNTRLREHRGEFFGRVRKGGRRRIRLSRLSLPFARIIMVYAIISRGGSSKNRNLVYLCAPHGVLPRRSTLPPAVGAARPSMWRARHTDAAR